MRSFRMLSVAESLPGLPGLNGGKTYAAWPVWSDSYRHDVRFAPMPKKQALKLYHKARAWNRQKFPGRYGGTLGSAATRVLECLIFDFLNFATGRLDPGYFAIARKTGMSRSTIATALARLTTRHSALGTAIHRRSGGRRALRLAAGHQRLRNPARLTMARLQLRPAARADAATSEHMGSYPAPAPAH
jgi:hypothetical protein